VASNHRLKRDRTYSQSRQSLSNSNRDNYPAQFRGNRHQITKKLSRSLTNNGYPLGSTHTSVGLRSAPSPLSTRHNPYPPGVVYAIPCGNDTYI
jgi:hypothetical protein